MKKLKLFLAFSLMALILVSCTSFKLSGTQVTKELPSYEVVGEFDINVKVTEFLGNPAGINLLNITADAMDTAIYDAIQREIQKYSGDAAVNVTIEYKAEVLDFLLSSFTFGIYTPATAHITGTVVKYN